MGKWISWRPALIEDHFVSDGEVTRDNDTDLLPWWHESLLDNADIFDTTASNDEVLVGFGYVIPDDGGGHG